MSGSKSTESREAATRPKIMTPKVTMKTVTGRLRETSTSFMECPPGRRSGADRLYLRALLESALAHGHHAVAFGDAGQNLRRIARDGAEFHLHAVHRIGACQEDEVLAVLREEGAARNDDGVVIGAGLQPHAAERARAKRTRLVGDLEGHLEGAVREIDSRIHDGDRGHVLLAGLRVG